MVVQRFCGAPAWVSPAFMPAIGAIHEPATRAGNLQSPERMNAIFMLRDDHKAILRLINRLRNARDALAARGLCDEFCETVELHSTLESEIFFPEVRRRL